jgi:4-hydroxy-tetrahydrodipicolinate synthase
LHFLVALPTPFDDKGRVDPGRLRAHVLWLRECGAEGFMVTDAAGEFPFLSDRERKVIHETVLDAASGLQVFVCPWDSSALTTIYLARQAERLGARALLMPPPMFYPVPPPVTERWFRELRDKVGIPLVARHDPGTVPTPVDGALYAELLRDGVLIGMEDASGDLPRVQRLAAAHPHTLLAADDRLLVKIRDLHQVRAFVSTLANAWPSLCLRAFQGDADAGATMLDLALAVDAAGGLPALKAVLRMGCRMPLPAAPLASIAGMPASEYPT